MWVENGEHHSEYCLEGYAARGSPRRKLRGGPVKTLKLLIGYVGGLVEPLIRVTRNGELKKGDSAAKEG